MDSARRISQLFFFLIFIHSLDPAPRKNTHIHINTQTKSSAVSQFLSIASVKTSWIVCYMVLAYFGGTYNKNVNVSTGERQYLSISISDRSDFIAQILHWKAHKTAIGLRRFLLQSMYTLVSTNFKSKPAVPTINFNFWYGILSEIWIAL